MFWGIAFIIAGLLLLLSQLHVIAGDFWDYLLPIVLIALGAKMMFDRKRHHY
ncbi:MAG: DUF5668 domain-containing protein [candidate division Zixibacteria bacterium]|jgi:uncharacterized membrane protein|nr:DUF5668 domain-containing protein [candidate division Zixibacteria bacterium]